MKRWGIRIAICLVLGIISTVVVAWVSAVLVGFADTASDNRAYRSSEAGAWGVETYHRFSAFRVEWFISRKSYSTNSDGPLPEDIIPTWISYEPELNEKHIMELWDAEARGWPLVALWSKPRHWYMALDSLNTLPVEGAIELPLSPFSGGMGDYQKVLPLRPIWYGFLIDTLFYAVIWFGLFFGIGTTRRIIRRKRGHCLKCAYDLQHNYESGCPECGWNREDNT